jgi:glycosyltransferase involved in cell wall biosynthesis
VAQLPYFVFSPNSLLSVIGLMRGPDTTRPTPKDDWREATVDLIIPAFNEKENIVRCLESVRRQTLQPRRIVLVDDGSSDDTAARARAFRYVHGLPITVLRRGKSIGKTPTIKEQARALDSDVLFILDADTVLESDNYIERTVQELYQAVGIASVCGMVLPLRQRDRRAAEESPGVQSFLEAFPFFRLNARRSRWRTLATGITNLYREVLYLFLQRFVYRGQMALFGTLCNPVGCAVAYRRRYLRALFDEVEPTLGDDLTNSEDIFIGFAMVNEGYRNIQLADVRARTVEPEVQKLPKQLSLWSSAFLQSAFYFDALLKSPFKALKRRRLRRRGASGRPGGPPGAGHQEGAPQGRHDVPAPVRVGAVAYAGMGGTPPNVAFAVAANVPDVLPGPWGRRAAAGPSISFPAEERRRIREPYRQAFGSEHTKALGRPAGWMVMSAAVEKVCFPTVLLAMALVRNWEGLLVTIGAETFLTVTALVLTMKGQRLEYVLKGIAVTPIRYGLLVTEFVTIARFAADLWLTKNRRWRK